MTLATKTKAALVCLGLATAALTGQSAQAMTLHNCTDWDLPVQLQDKTGSISRSTHLAPYGSRSVHATSSFGPYRIILPTLGPGAHFSGRSGDGTFSLTRTDGGNIAIRDGKACHHGTPSHGGGGSQLCVTDKWGNKVCVRP